MSAFCFFACSAQAAFMMEILIVTFVAAIFGARVLLRRHTTNNKARKSPSQRLNRTSPHTESTSMLLQEDDEYEDYDDGEADLKSIKFTDLPKPEQERLEVLFYSSSELVQRGTCKSAIPTVVLKCFGHDGSIGARTSLLNKFRRSNTRYIGQTAEVADFFDWYTQCEGLTTWPAFADGP